MGCVVLLSGGLDSSVLLAHAVHSFGVTRVTALSVDYGQMHHVELRAAEQVAEHFGVRFVLARCPLATLVRSALTGTGTDVVVPGRNVVLMSLALGLAMSSGADWIWIGCNADDAELFPDCRPAAIAAMADLSMIASEGRVQVEAPWLTMSKVDIVQRGRALGVPLELTVSCYRGMPPCGSCLACSLRARALAARGTA